MLRQHTTRYVVSFLLALAFSQTVEAEQPHPKPRNAQLSEITEEQANKCVEAGGCYLMTEQELREGLQRAFRAGQGQCNVPTGLRKARQKMS